jgi:hypothetical protein
MKQHEQDRDLAAWLASYEVADIAPAACDALMKRIIANAAACPRSKRFTLALREWRIGWRQDAVAFAAVAAAGFWIGSLSVGLTETSSIAATAANDSTYLTQVVFGPASWREVNL